MVETDTLTVPRLFNLNLEFLRHSLPADAHAHARVVSLTRRFANLRVTAFHDDPDDPITVATAQFVRGV